MIIGMRVTATSVVCVLLALAANLAHAELGNTLENFHANSPFTRKLGFVYYDSLKLTCPAGLGLTEPKYSYSYRYRNAAMTENPSQLVLRTLRNPRIIGEETLTIAAQRGMNETQKAFLVTFIDESTRSAVSSTQLVPEMVAFVEQSYARFYHTGKRHFETASVVKSFIVEMKIDFRYDDTQFIVTIGRSDSKQQVPCTGD